MTSMPIAARVADCSERYRRLIAALVSVRGHAWIESELCAVAGVAYPAHVRGALRFTEAVGTVHLLVLDGVR